MRMRKIFTLSFLAPRQKKSYHKTFAQVLTVICVRLRRVADGWVVWRHCVKVRPDTVLHWYRSWCKLVVAKQVGSG